METKSEELKIAVPSLGIGTAIFIGVTLNYPPSMRVKVQKNVTKWVDMSLHAQRSCFLQDLREIYLCKSTYIHASFELCKSGELHCHALLEIKDNPNYLNFVLSDIRKFVLSHSISQYRHKGDRHHIVHSNYIHEVNPQKWIAYMQKDQKLIPYKMISLCGHLSEGASAQDF